MIQRISICLLILSTLLSALPASAAMSWAATSDREASCVKTEFPPAPDSTDGRRGSERTKQTDSYSPQKLRAASSWWSWLLMLAMVAPAFVLTWGGRSAMGQEPPPAVETALFPETGYGGEPNWVTPAAYEDPEFRPQPCPPALPGCWLSGGHIRVAKIENYHRIPALDREGGLFDTWRPNLINKEVPDEWDFQNLINTDRPDFTDATFSVGQGVAKLESGYTFRQSNSSDIHLSRQQLPEALLRVGVTDEFELRIKWNGLVTTDTLDRGTQLKTTDVGGDDLQLGVKYEVLQQDGIRPMLTFVGGVVVPTGTRGVSSNQVQPNGQFVYGWGLRRWLFLKGSTGVDFVKTSSITQVVNGSLALGPAIVAAEDNVSQWHQSFSLLFQATPRVGGFLEWFSFFSTNDGDNRASNYLDAGLYFYITPNVQFDVKIGERVSDRVDTLFTGAGFSTRW